MLQDIVALIDPATCDNVGSPSVCCFDARGGWLKVVERAGTRAASLPDYRRSWECCARSVDRSPTPAAAVWITSRKRPC